MRVTDQQLIDQTTHERAIRELATVAKAQDAGEVWRRVIEKHGL